MARRSRMSQAAGGRAFKLSENRTESNDASKVVVEQSGSSLFAMAFWALAMAQQQCQETSSSAMVLRFEGPCGRLAGDEQQQQSPLLNKLQLTREKLEDYNQDEK